MRLPRITGTTIEPFNTILLLSTLTLLAGCSDSEPDGYVFQMNGAGMTLPAAGTEVASRIFLQSIKRSVCLCDRGSWH